MRFMVVLVMLSFLLSSCGGSSGNGTDTKKASPSAKPSPSASRKKPRPSADASATPSPTVAAPKGTPAPQAMSDFLCAKDSKGNWNATGVLRNDRKKSATYQVTVFVGYADGKETEAQTKEFASIAAGGSYAIEMDKLPVEKDATACHYQVLMR